jgi:hypothetical protein
MRTTLTLDDDIADLVARQAKARGLSMGKTVSDLVRRGLQAPTPSIAKDGLVVFQLPADSPKVTTEDVRRFEADNQGTGKPRSRMRASMPASRPRKLR